MQEDKRIARIKVGNYCKIENSYKNIGVDVWIGSYVTIRPDVHIGDRTEIRNYCFLAEGCRIGKDVRIFQYSNIGAWCQVDDKVYIGARVTLLNDRKLVYLRANFNPEPVVICRGARIGSGAVILPGVIIEENSVIGAGSVVTKSVPAGQVWVGNPAGYIRDVLKEEFV